MPFFTFADFNVRLDCSWEFFPAALEILHFSLRTGGAVLLGVLDFSSCCSQMSPLTGGSCARQRRGGYESGIPVSLDFSFLPVTG